MVDEYDDNSGALGAVEEINTTDEHGVTTRAAAKEQPQAETAPDNVGEQDGQDAQEPQAQPEQTERKKTGYVRKLAAKDAELAEKQARIAELEAKLPKPVASDERPKLENFDSWEDFTDAMTDWKIEQREKQRSIQSREEQLRNEQKAKLESYQAKADAFAKANPDFDEVITEFEGWTPGLVQAVQDSDIGPEVAYYLAKNTDEAQKLAGMGVVALNRAIGRIEAKLEGRTQAAETTQMPKTTQAPPPLATPRGTSTSAANPYEKDMSADEWKAWRAKQKR